MPTLDEQILAQLASEDAFEKFKQMCRDLRNGHARFSYEYDIIVPQLLQVHDRMKRSRELEDYFEMDGLLFALRVFNEKALAFSAAGSTDEENFQSRIEEVIAIIKQLRSNFNTIYSKIDLYEDEEEEKNGSDIGEQLEIIVIKMKEMGELMQLFSATEIDILQKKVITAGRAEKKKNSGETLDRISEVLNAEIQQLTEDHESRKRLNYEINDIKTFFLTDLDEQFLKAYRVLSAPAEFYKKLRPKHKQATRSHLGRFQEILSAINSKLNEIEQYLTLFEWEDVEMSHVNVQIKIQISSLFKIIAELTPILELGNVGIDPVKTEAFFRAKEILFEQIENMDVIHEKRDQIIEAIRKRHAIQQRQEEIMPNI
ncbi:unnamed protein product [Caenorhabditis brenneri]